MPKRAASSEAPREAHRDESHHDTQSEQNQFYRSVTGGSNAGCRPVRIDRSPPETAKLSSGKTHNPLDHVASQVFKLKPKLAPQRCSNSCLHCRTSHGTRKCDRPTCQGGSVLRDCGALMMATCSSSKSTFSKSGPSCTESLDSGSGEGSLKHQAYLHQASQMMRPSGPSSTRLGYLVHCASFHQSFARGQCKAPLDRSLPSTLRTRSMPDSTAERDACHGFNQEIRTVAWRELTIHSAV